MNIFSTAQMHAAEAEADAAGLTYDALMEEAGKQTAAAIILRYEKIQAAKILILVGAGNNGGDGLVAGRYLAEAGADVVFYLAAARDPETDPNLKRINELALPLLAAAQDMQYRVLHHRLHLSDIVVDALLGTGVSRPIAGTLAKILRQVSRVAKEKKRLLKQPSTLYPINTPYASPSPSPFWLVAVDAPSGLNCDDGTADPLTLSADLTITFAGAKRGHLYFPGAAHCGELIIADIGIPADLSATTNLPQLMTADAARELLPQRPLDGHKGTFGTTLIAAGSHAYWGAPFLAALAALRCGSGLVTLAVPADIRAALATQLPEAIFLPLADRSWLQANAAREIGENSQRYQALLIGPGMERCDFFLESLLEKYRDSLPPAIFDADALNWLAQQDNWWQLIPPHSILTPHPGEMARLLQLSSAAELPRDRIKLAQEMAAVWGHIVLLKGAYTVVAAPDGKITVLPWANPALAIPGSGDVLGGIIASLIGQGLSTWDAARLGGYIHGASACGKDNGVLAREIPEAAANILHTIAAA